MNSAQPAGSAYALLADGATIEIRAATPADFVAVRQMYRSMSPDNIYLRFFSMSTAAADDQAQRACREPAADHATRLAWLAGELVGVASYECCRAARQSRRSRSPWPITPTTGAWHAAYRAPGVGRPRPGGADLHR